MKKRSLISILVLIMLFVSACAIKPNIDEVTHNVALVEFPGVKWGMTPNEVIEALNLNEDQILDNAMYIPDEYDAETEYDTWNMYVRNINFLDSDVLGAHFAFIRYPDCDFALLYIGLNLSEGTDANALKEKMVEVYGEGSIHATPLYSFENGKLVANDTDPVNTYKFKEGFPYYFISSITGTEYFTTETQQSFVDFCITSPKISREAALEYLEKQPLVEVTVSARNETQKVTGGNSSISITFRANQLIHLLQKYAK